MKEKFSRSKKSLKVHRTNRFLLGFAQIFFYYTLFGQLLVCSLQIFSCTRTLRDPFFLWNNLFHIFDTILFDSHVNSSFDWDKIFFTCSLETNGIRTSAHLIPGLHSLFLIMFFFPPKNNASSSALFLF